MPAVTRAGASSRPRRAINDSKAARDDAAAQPDLMFALGVIFKTGWTALVLCALWRGVRWLVREFAAAPSSLRRRALAVFVLVTLLLWTAWTRMP